jgi:hypothetical protein
VAGGEHSPLTAQLRDVGLVLAPDVIVKRHELAVANGGLHAVRFYDDDQALCRMVADFLADGLNADQPAVIVAIRGHREAIQQRLHERGFAVADLIASGRLDVRDAHELLRNIMRNGEPQAERFDAAIEPLLIDAGRAGSGVARVYGEMVNVLWRRGQTRAATTLELQWNRLAKRHEFSLLCAYSMGSFLKDAVGDICRLHTHVFDETGDPLRVQ